MIDLGKPESWPTVVCKDGIERPLTWLGVFYGELPEVPGAPED